MNLENLKRCLQNRDEEMNIDYYPFEFKMKRRKTQQRQRGTSPLSDDLRQMFSHLLVVTESPQSQVFRNPPILDEVSWLLNLSDLKNLRLVNASCNRIASHIILNRNLTAIHITYIKGLKRFIKGTAWNNGKQIRCREVIDLLDILRRSSSTMTSFPCSDFSFTGGDLSATELKPLFSNYGHLIKTLRIFPGGIASSVFTSIETYRHLLRKLSNIQVLEFGSFPYLFVEDPVTVPSLKTLICSSDNYKRSAAFDLIDLSSEHLELVSGFKSTYIDRFVMTGKVHTIKDYYFTNDFREITKMRAFANALPKLETLTLDIKCEEDETLLNKPYCEALTEILKASKNTLKDLSINVRGLFCGLQFPELNQLTKLSLNAMDYISCDEWINFKRELSNNEVNLNESFPNVEVVVLKAAGYHWDNHSFPVPFTFNGSMPSAKVLHVYEPWRDGHCCFYSWAVLFPNVTTLILEGDENPAGPIPDICKYYPHLEEIVFASRFLEDNIGYEDYQDFDASITGIPAETCSDLVELDYFDEEILPDICTLKQSLSIVDLKSLKKLKIRVITSELSEGFSPNFMSFLSVVYALDICQQQHVDVSIAFNHNCDLSKKIATALNHIPPRIKIIHED